MKRVKRESPESAIATIQQNIQQQQPQHQLSTSTATPVITDNYNTNMQLLDILPLPTLISLLCLCLTFDSDHSLLLFGRTCRQLYQILTNDSQCWKNQIGIIFLTDWSFSDEFFYKQKLVSSSSTTPKLLEQLRQIMGDRKYNTVILPRLNERSSQTFEQGDKIVEIYPQLSQDFIERILYNRNLSLYHDFRTLLWPRYFFRFLNKIIIRCCLEAEGTTDTDFSLLLILKRFSCIKSLTLDESGSVAYYRDLVRFSDLLSKPSLRNIRELEINNFFFSFENSLLPLMKNRSLIKLIIKNGQISAWEHMDQHCINGQIQYNYQPQSTSDENIFVENNQLVTALAKTIIDKLKERQDLINQFSQELRDYYLQRMSECQAIVIERAENKNENKSENIATNNNISNIDDENDDDGDDDEDEDYNFTANVNAFLAAISKKK